MLRGDDRQYYEASMFEEDSPSGRFSIALQPWPNKFIIIL